MPGTPQTANLNGEYKMIGGHAGEPVLLRPGAVQSAAGRRARGIPAATSSAVPGYWNMDFSIFRAFPIGGGRQARGVPRGVLQPDEHAEVGPNPDGDVNSGNFGRTYGGRRRRDASDAGSGERQIRFGLRFQF